MGIFLLIVAGLIAWFFISAMNRAKTRMAYADAQEAKREIAELDREPYLKPSWVNVDNSREEFLQGALLLAERNGTPVSFGGLYFTEEDEVDELLHYIALLQRRGSSFTDQKIAATRFISERLQGLPSVIQDHYRETTVASVGHLKPNWAGIRKITNAFVSDMYILVEARSIPPTFFTSLMADDEAISEMMHTMALTQFEGGSFDDQKEAAGQWVFDRWLVLPRDDQEPFMDQHFKSMMGSA